MAFCALRAVVLMVPVRLMAASLSWLRKSNVGSARRFRASATAEGLALRELEAATSFRMAVLLPLHHARVSREKTARFQRGAQRRLIGNQRTADTMPDGARLPR